MRNGSLTAGDAERDPTQYIIEVAACRDGRTIPLLLRFVSYEPARDRTPFDHDHGEEPPKAELRDHRHPFASAGLAALAHTDEQAASDPLALAQQALDRLHELA